ncbi:MAG: thioredoxin [Alphaproteobacteria bacterium]|nr:thioredoxin [Alphaproteobacteria bacterium]
MDIDLTTAKGPSEAPVIDSSTDGFMADVIDASIDKPIVVDFWAPWCGPCKQLTPILEKLTKSAKGAIRLVKINIDENQELARQLRIASIPTVYAFKDGRPVDAFQGAQTETQVKAFIDRLMKKFGGPALSPVDEAMAAAAEAAQTEDWGGAAAIYDQILAHEPGHVKAAAGLARALLKSGDAVRARVVIDGLTGAAASDAEVTSVRTSLDLAERAAASAGQHAGLEARLLASADDHEARYELALAEYGAGRPETAIDLLLELFRRNRAWNEDAARRELVKLFEALGPTHALTVTGRRKLSAMMFK